MKSWLFFAWIGLSTAISAPSYAQDFIPLGKTFSYQSTKSGAGFGGSGPDIEEGVYKGMSYRFSHGDGNGVVGDWMIDCAADAMTDQRQCSAYKGHLWVFVRSATKAIVSIGESHFPGSNVYLRIDSAKPTTTSSKNDGDFSSATSAVLITKLRDAQNATTRYMEWPYQQWIDEVVSLEAFPQAWEYLNWAVSANKIR